MAVPKDHFATFRSIRGILNILINGKNGEAYNIGNDEMVSIRNVTKALLQTPNTM